MRRISALLTVSALAAVALTACAPTTGGANSIDGCEASFDAGSTSSTVTATGTSGQPAVDFPTPLVSPKSQRSTITAGTGDPIPSGYQADFAYAVYLGTTGDLLGAQGYSGATDGSDTPVRGEVGLLAADGGNSIARALTCAQVGGRYALTTSIHHSFGDSVAQQVGLDPTTTLVIVFDVLDAFPGKSDGVNQLPLDGMPYVATAVDGTPGITLPDAPLPTKLRISTLKLGSGPVVKDGDTASLQYSLWIWPADGGDPQFSQSSWSSHRAADFQITAGAVIPGFVDSVVGQKVGSQVLSVIPPDQGYGDSPPQGIPAGATLVYVIDILAIQSK